MCSAHMLGELVSMYCSLGCCLVSEGKGKGMGITAQQHMFVVAMFSFRHKENAQRT
jgi:hypothetical protein